MLRNFCSPLLFLAISCATCLAADWDPKLAAKYLDDRQKQWFDWSITKSSSGPCVSCHTGLPYLLSRPHLRKALAETNKTEFETGLLEGLQTRLASGEAMFKSFKKEPLRSQGFCVEAILSVLALSADGHAPDAASKKVKKAAWDRLWSLEYPPGARRQVELWPWFNLDLHPYESEGSAYYGASLVAVAAGKDLSNSDKKRFSAQLRSLTDNLHQNFQNQPIHNRLLALWASARLPGILNRKERDQLLSEVWQRQESDGGWPIAALGPWSDRPSKPESSGSSAYATALVLFTFQQAGEGCSDPRLQRGKEWLRSRQDQQTGAWLTSSMNKHYPQDSMQVGFMNDAASSFAVLALLDPGACESQKEAKLRHDST
jgi:squalene-hopene/tetraprenyl-beta-curcumene cyclase